MLNYLSERSLYCFTTQVVTYRWWATKSLHHHFSMERNLFCFGVYTLQLYLWFNQTQICHRLLLTFQYSTTETNHFTGKKHLNLYRHREKPAYSHTPACRWCVFLQLLWFLLYNTYQCLIYCLNCKILKNMD